MKPLAALVSLSMALGAAQAAADPPALEDAIRVPQQTVAPGKSVEVPLPALPAKPGKALLLRFRAVVRTSGPGGCNWNLAVRLNDAPISRYSADGTERLVGREPSLEFADGKTGTFAVFNDPSLMMMFAPDVKTGDAMTTDGLGATFALEISDIARGVDGNTLTLRDNVKEPLPGGFGDLVVQDIEVGWVGRERLPRPKDEVPERGPIAGAVTAGGLRLAQGKAGGFAVRLGSGPEVLVETALGMKREVPAALPAQDALLPGGEAKVTVQPARPDGYRVTAVWPGVKLERTLAIRSGLVSWKERWTNTGPKTAGIPFRHRVFLRGEAGRFLLGGSSDTNVMVAASQNPTLFVESRKQAGAGAGIIAESDWLRLLMSLRGIRGVGEIASNTLALAAGASVEFELTITPVREGGYWSFLNGVRRRWGLNGHTMPRPAFWGWARAAGGVTPEETVRRSLGHLGPVTVVLGPWLGLAQDARPVMAGEYPKLAAGAPPTPGPCPDLDVEAFVTFRHRAASSEAFAKETAAIHAACPQAKVIEMIHPAMEAVYKPLQERWPISGESIRTAEGAAFEDGSYSRSWVGGMAAKGWGVLYYVPRAGSAYLAELLRRMRSSMDAGADGIYSDEFSWAYTSRGYSRYDYSRWDGRSADLDADGNVVRMKSDNAFVTESAQLQMARTVLDRGGFFLANGGPSLRSITSIPMQRFVEGGNGYWWMANAHLTATPLILGNMGDEKTRKGVFDSVKTCLSLGCIYSPTAVNLLLEGADNFVCKLYPITVREIGPGTVQGEERLVTTVSGSYAWPGRPSRVRLYRYDAEGKLLQEERGPKPAAGRLKVDVPEKGLAIAEVVP